MSSLMVLKQEPPGSQTKFVPGRSWGRKAVDEKP